MSATKLSKVHMLCYHLEECHRRHMFRDPKKVDELVRYCRALAGVVADVMASRGDITPVDRKMICKYHKVQP